MSNNNKQIYNYTVFLEKESNGGYHAFCPILKVFESLRADNQSIPRSCGMQTTE
jgi:predicted RNase H-like HicB family nuclease